jgi:hypothetical protein
MMANAYLYRVTLGGLTFGVDVDDGVITGVAPVAKWMQGKTIAWAVDYWRRRKAHVQWMKWPDGEWERDP